jgi:hypothetical protein
MRKYKTKTDQIWIIVIPCVYGHGLTAAAKTKAGAIAALRRSWPGDESFQTAFEYYGGYIRRIKFGNIYNDGFRG